jgi:Trk K+ transport system NAD-binding subunit
MSRYVAYIRDRIGEDNLKFVYRFFLGMMALILTYTILFHLLQEREGNVHTWFTGLYWTLTTMTTLGYGDITFKTDAGRIFTVCVLLTGMITLLIILPFAFIEFVYQPWMKVQSKSRAPVELSDDIRDHVVITHYDEVTHNLITKLRQYNYEYVLVIADLDEALQLHDQGLHIVHGDLDNPSTYRKVHVDQAALVTITSKDTVNTSVAFTVRDISEKVPIITTANSVASVDILELAGSSHVIQLGQQMGRFLGRMATGVDSMSHVIGKVEGLMFAEAGIGGTPLVDKTLKETRLREITGVTVVGVWERGRFEPATAETLLSERIILVLMGTEEQIMEYNELFAIYHVSEAPIIIIGGGRVGRAAGATLAENNVDYRIIEQRQDRIKDNDKYIFGDAAELETLKQAGIMESPTVIITSHEDDTNVYLTIYCRRLRPDIQIISRAKLERNVDTLHRAGADFVMSYASMGANIIFNLLKRNNIVMITEGLNLFRVKLPVELAAKTIGETEIQQNTGCYITAVYAGGTMHVNPDPSMRLPAESEVILIGSIEAENTYLKIYGKGE